MSSKLVPIKDVALKAISKKIKKDSFGFTVPLKTADNHTFNVNFMCDKDITKVKDIPMDVLLQIKELSDLLESISYTALVNALNFKLEQPTDSLQQLLELDAGDKETQLKAYAEYYVVSEMFVENGLVCEDDNSVELESDSDELDSTGLESVSSAHFNACYCDILNKGKDDYELTTNYLNIFTGHSIRYITDQTCKNPANGDENVKYCLEARIGVYSQLEIYNVFIKGLITRAMYRNFKNTDILSIAPSYQKAVDSILIAEQILSEEELENNTEIEDDGENVPRGTLEECE